MEETEYYVEQFYKVFKNISKKVKILKTKIENSEIQEDKFIYLLNSVK